MKDFKVFRDNDGDIWLGGDGIYQDHVVCVTSEPDTLRRMNYPTLPYENVDRTFGLTELTALKRAKREAHLADGLDDMLFPKGYSVD
jgi:hypothetical protein